MTRAISNWSTAAHFQVRGVASNPLELQKVQPQSQVPISGFPRGLTMNGDGDLAYAGPGSDISNFVHCYRKITGVWEKQSDFVDLTVPTGDKFGIRVVLDDTASKMVIGATGLTPTGCAIYFYANENNVWVKKQTFQSPYDSDAALRRNFGQSLAISANGAYLAVGSLAAGYTGVAGTNFGLLCIYHFNGTEWVYETEIRGNATTKIASYGVALDAVGNTLLMGVFNPTTYFGGVEVYERVGGVLTYKETLVHPQPTVNDGFGTSAAISNDGLVCYIGTWLSDLNAIADSGSVCVFKRPTVNSAFVYVATMVPTDPSVNGLFGFGLATNRNGSKLLISAPNDSSMFPNGGAFYYFNTESFL